MVHDASKERRKEGRKERLENGMAWDGMGGSNIFSQEPFGGGT